MLFKIIKFLLILIWLLAPTYAENHNNTNQKKIDFWTNAINEILIRFRYNKITHQLEMAQDSSEEIKDKSINISTKPNALNDTPLKSHGNVTVNNITNDFETKFVTFKVTDLRDRPQNGSVVIVKQISAENMPEKILTTLNETLTTVDQNLEKEVLSMADPQLQNNKSFGKSVSSITEDEDEDSITAVKDDFIDFDLKKGLQSIDVPSPKTKLPKHKIAQLPVSNHFGVDACSKNCSKEAHIACGHSWTFSSKCSNKAKLINLRKFHHLILHHHNTLRSNLAGNLTRFEPAARMGTTQWHNELAAYARLNAMACNDEHDFCHNTNEFKWTGQNLAVLFWTGRKKDLAEILTKMISNWHSENVNTEQSDLDKFSRSKGLNNGVISHFTNIVNERNTHIGCAAVAEKKGRFSVIYFTCNYARNNILDLPIYEKGPTASKCSSGVNPKYKNLCSVKEKYDYNV